MPVTAGNFVSSCGEAGELSSESVSASDAAVGFVAGFVVASEPAGVEVVVVSLGEEESFDFAAALSVRPLPVATMAVPSCAVFTFHQIPPTTAAMTTTASSISGMPKRRGEDAA